MDIQEKITKLRKETKALAAEVKTLLADARAVTNKKEADTGEMAANIMLTYRHLEDAGMRLGKVIQAYDGGVSVYDK